MCICMRARENEGERNDEQQEYFVPYVTLTAVQRKNCEGDGSYKPVRK